MVVISKTIITDFGRRHADAVDPLNDWWKITKKRSWGSLADIKKDFGSVDYAATTGMFLLLKGKSTD